MSNMMFATCKTGHLKHEYRIAEINTGIFGNFYTLRRFFTKEDGVFIIDGAFSLIVSADSYFEITKKIKELNSEMYYGVSVIDIKSSIKKRVLSDAESPDVYKEI